MCLDFILLFVVQAIGGISGTTSIHVIPKISKMTNNRLAIVKQLLWLVLPLWS
jgi:hypothetical protein